MKKVLFFMLLFLLALFCVFFSVFTTEGGKEFFYKYRAEIFTTTGNAILFVLGLAFKVYDAIENKRLSFEIEATRDPVIDATNNMIDGYNAMKQGYDEHASLEHARDRAIAVVMAQNAFIVEALQTVYANSKNLPQGIKDIINLKYAKCAKAIGDDETLKRLSEVFRKELDAAAGDETVTQEKQ
ncbi:MAG: hypothetical protein IKA46_02900 [Clostridia bacterium]|nr:hypothetical protein [Clostridia bacterium]MBR3862735.1 hypothetical protein [Clostridia bacterium]